MRVAIWPYAIKCLTLCMGAITRGYQQGRLSMSSSFKARYLKALKAERAAMTAVYDAVTSNNVVFSECRKLASPEAVAAYDAAWAALYELDHEAEQSGRAYQAREAARATFYFAS